MLLLALSGLAIMLTGHHHSTLLSSIPAGLHFKNPFLRSILFGSAGLLGFFLLRAILDLLRRAISNVSSSAPPDEPPPALVEENRAPIPPRLQSSASPKADLRDASRRDSRFRTRAQFSRVKGQADDYNGPFRRATDRRSDAAQTNPGHRASGREASERKQSDDTAMESRPANRRSASGAHRIAELQGTSPKGVNEEAGQGKGISTDTSLLEPDLSISQQKGWGAGNAVLHASIAHAPLDSPADIPPRR